MKKNNCFITLSEMLIGSILIYSISAAHLSPMKGEGRGLLSRIASGDESAILSIVMFEQDGASLPSSSIRIYSSVS